MIKMYRVGVRSNLYRSVTALGSALGSAALFLSAAACGSGMQAGSPAGSLSASPQMTGNVEVTPVNKDAWDKLNVDGAPTFGSFKLFQVISIDKATKELVLKLPMPPNPYVDGISMAPIEVKKLPGSRIGIEAVQGGGSVLTFRVPLIHIIRKDVNFPSPTALPNGDPLPAVADGSLPSEAMTINDIKKINATFYFAVQQLGIFVNTPFDPLVGLSIPIKSADGTRTWGYLTSIPAKKAPAPAMDGGFFISIQLPDDIARIIDDNL